jgi:peptide deformylase
MAVLEIVTPPEPVLRRKARKVTDFGPDLQTLVEDMIETMRVAPGVGLAAPQVNQSLRLIVVEYGEEDEDANQVAPRKLYAVANPEIVKVSPEMEVGVEGCLSIPGYAGEVERSLGVVIKGQNRRGQPVRIKAEGWLARIFQHEIDHLEGVLFTDRAERVWELSEEEKETPLLD